MASRKMGSTGAAFKGKVGNVIMSTWMNLEITKSLPVRKSSTVQSPKQCTQNNKFRLVQNFLRRMKYAINIGYQKPKNKSMTPMNMACSYLMTTAIVIQNDDLYIDMALVKFSQPIWLTQQAWKPQVKAEEGKMVTVTWELNPYLNKDSKPQDRVIVVMYDKNQGSCYQVGTCGTRETGFFTAKASETQVGHEFACYIFVASQDGKLVSETEYLGLVTILD